jgi:hypothetical protein
MSLKAVITAELLKHYTTKLYTFVREVNVIGQALNSILSEIV